MTATRVGNVLVAPGDGDTDGGLIYIQSTECQDWIAFQVEHAEGVIAAIRKAQRRIMEGVRSGLTTRSELTERGSE